MSIEEGMSKLVESERKMRLSAETKFAEAKQLLEKTQSKDTLLVAKKEGQEVDFVNWTQVSERLVTK